jgi:hypothetical protein
MLEVKVTLRLTVSQSVSLGVDSHLGLMTGAVILGSVSRGTRDHILLSGSRLPQPGGSGSRIYIPQEEGGSVRPSVTGFPLLQSLS